MRVIISVSILLFACGATLAADFRMYSANRQFQEDRVSAVNEDEPGCHNLLWKSRVYRVAQIGYKYCSVYREKDCEDGSEIQVTWKKEDAAKTQFSQGARWYLIDEHPRGAKLGSWYCEAK